MDYDLLLNEEIIYVPRDYEGNIDAGLIVNHIKNNPDLKIIEILRFDNFTENDILKIIEAIKNHNSINEIRSYRLFFHNLVTVTSFFDMLKDNNLLTSINLGLLLCRNVEYFQLLVDAISVNITMVNLRIEFVKDEHVAYLVNLLRNNNTLKTLNLYEHRLSRTGMLRLTESLVANNTLEKLDLYSSCITVADLDAIADSLDESYFSANIFAGRAVVSNKLNQLIARNQVIRQNRRFGLTKSAANNR